MIKTKIDPNFLKERREELGLSKRDVVWRIESLGVKVHYQAYSKLEEGTKSFEKIMLPLAIAITYALECTLDDIYTYQEDGVKTNGTA